MAKTNSLVSKLAAAYPDLHFEKGDDFLWSPRENTVYYVDDSSAASRATLLHETAHGLLGHRAYTRDIDLIKIECEAWRHARHELAPFYDVTIDDDRIEQMVDTYRDWLHARSKCPHCSMTGVQTDEHTYHCFGCNRDWRVNDARRCGLRRYAL